jgi:hypothetical protein
VRYLWIVIGSRLKNYCQLMGIARAIGDLGQAIGFRHTLAYVRPAHVDDEIVWRTSRDDLEPATSGCPADRACARAGVTTKANPSELSCRARFVP